ncbi:hypothetical protein [Candidatus Nanohalococcus occultus]|uniref:Uncharacterized protein n=1 Tax=Candidatus Nanohalococcus occultus TaxID=2978047 RepID=A0ABY8CGB9_9ARCH|nr:hypothetical protein SVXNc_0765 [Candidatus Nanohaloarchaeota archaeon SVXNc]
MSRGLNYVRTDFVRQVGSVNGNTMYGKGDEQTHSMNYRGEELTFHEDQNESSDEIAKLLDGNREAARELVREAGYKTEQRMRLVVTE